MLVCFNYPSCCTVLSLSCAVSLFYYSNFGGKWPVYITYSSSSFVRSFGFIYAEGMIDLDVGCYVYSRSCWYL